MAAITVSLSFKRSSSIVPLLGIELVANFSWDQPLKGWNLLFAFATASTPNLCMWILEIRVGSGLQVKLLKSFFFENVPCATTGILYRSNDVIAVCPQFRGECNHWQQFGFHFRLIGILSFQGLDCETSQGICCHKSHIWSRCILAKWYAKKGMDKQSRVKDALKTSLFRKIIVTDDPVESDSSPIAETSSCDLPV